jgi:hypothetical protein
VAWEKRKGHRYYYQGERVRGRVRKVYLGTDEIAQALAHADATIRRTKELKRERERAERERLEALTSPIEELCEVADVLVRAHLLAAGFARHKGEWRRRREPNR